MKKNEIGKMKEDEKKFFIVCCKYIEVVLEIDNKTITKKGYLFVGQVIDIIKNWMPKKRAFYYLQKWSRLGFYNAYSEIDNGILELHKMPERYLELIGCKIENGKIIKVREVK